MKNNEASVLVGAPEIKRLCTRCYSASWHEQEYAQSRQGFASQAPISSTGVAHQWGDRAQETYCGLTVDAWKGWWWHEAASASGPVS